MRAAVVGSRKIVDKELVDDILDQYPGITGVVSGGAGGVDTIAEYWANARLMSTTVFKADWDRYGKSAGFIRNSDIINASDIVIAIWDGVSKGTLDSIAKAKKANKPCDVWLVQGSSFKRIQSEITLS